MGIQQKEPRDSQWDVCDVVLISWVAGNGVRVCHHGDWTWSSPTILRRRQLGRKLSFWWPLTSKTSVNTLSANCEQDKITLVWLYWTVMMQLLQNRRAVTRHHFLSMEEFQRKLRWRSTYYEELIQKDSQNRRHQWPGVTYDESNLNLLHCTSSFIHDFFVLLLVTLIMVSGLSFKSFWEINLLDVFGLNQWLKNTDWRKM